MATQMQKAISNCEQCIQHEGTCTKGLMWTIIVTEHLECLHVDFTSIETTIELYQPSNLVNLLVFCDHFMKHIIAYMTPNQTAKNCCEVSVARIYLVLWSTSQAPEWPRSQLWKQHHQRAVQAYRHTVCYDFTLPCSNQWTGGTSLTKCWCAW